MDKFQEMRVFNAVVEANSFVAAADALGMSKAAVSRHVSELELRLGVRLLHRTTRKLSLTQEGTLFWSRCKDILASIEASESEISKHSVSVHGLLKMNVPISFGIRHLAPLWPEFLNRYPQINLDVQLADRLVDLVDEGFDLAVRIGQLPDSTLISRQIATTRLVLCAAPDYLERQGFPRHPLELAQHDLLAYSLLATGDQWHFNGPAGPVSVKVRARLWTNNGDSCIAASLNGAGIQLQPTFLVDDDLRNGNLVEILPDFRAMAMGVYVVYPTRMHLLPKVRAMVDFLAEKFKQVSWSEAQA